MVSMIEAIIILVVGIALVLIANRIPVNSTVNNILYIIGTILVIVGILFFVLALLGMALLSGAILLP